MKKIILVYRHLIILSWEIIILTLFKFINNFHFENGTSIIFIILVFVLPLLFYIYTSVMIWKSKIRHKVKMQGYFQLLLRDNKKGKLDEYLIDEIKKLGYNVEIEITNDLIFIMVKKNYNVLILIKMEHKKTTVEIIDTLVHYNFYYSYVTNDFTKYDLRNFEYKDTTLLYSSIVSLITKLSNHKYKYVQQKHLVKLIKLDTNEDIYIRKYPIVISKTLEAFTREIKL